MLPFLTQPAVATACYVPRAGSVIEQSQIFRGAQYIQRTPAVAGDPNKQTFAFWQQRSVLGAQQTIITSGLSGGYYTSLSLKSGDQLAVTDSDAAGVTYAPLLRDPGACQHGVLAIDMTLASLDKFKNYANGALLAASGTAPSTMKINNSGVFLRIGADYAGTSLLRSGLSEIFIIDGAALTPDVFGEFNIHGVWVPRPRAEIYAAIAAAGGWGPNGCHLDFSDPLNPGKDVSGQGNHWTATGFDAGGADTVDSTPTNVYAALSPINKHANIEVSAGGRHLRNTAANDRSGAATIYLRSGRWQWEVTPTGAGSGYPYIGIVRSDVQLRSISQAVSARAGGFEYTASGSKRNNNTMSAYGASFGAGNVIGVDLDLDAGTLTFYKNGVSQGVAFSGLSGLFAPCGSCYAGKGELDFNFGPDFAHPVAGTSPICTANLPEPDVKDPAEAFASEAATGANLPAVLDAATASWNGAGYIEIAKRRDASEDWRWRFSDDEANAWASNNANAKAAAPALTADGSYVGYRLRVGTKYGVYTAEVVHANGVVTTVTHGLATARNAVIATRVSVGGGDRWYRHPDLTVGKLFKLNSGDAAFTDGTLTNFGANSFDIAAAAPSGTYRVIALAEVSGFISFGKYESSNLVDGPFAAMTVLPSLFLAKADYASMQHVVFDASRDPTNVVSRRIDLNLPGAEYQLLTPTNGDMADFVVGGCKIRAFGGSLNYLPAYIHFLAVGRPIGGVCVAPATAR